MHAATAKPTRPSSCQSLAAVRSCPERALNCPWRDTSLLQAGAERALHVSPGEAAAPGVRRPLSLGLQDHVLAARRVMSFPSPGGRCRICQRPRFPEAPTLGIV